MRRGGRKLAERRAASYEFMAVEETGVCLGARRGNQSEKKSVKATRFHTRSLHPAFASLAHFPRNVGTQTTKPRIRRGKQCDASLLIRVCAETRLRVPAVYAALLHTMCCRRDS